LLPLEEAPARALFETAFGLDTFGGEELLFIIVRDELYLLHDTKVFALANGASASPLRKLDERPIRFVGYARKKVLGFGSPRPLDRFDIGDPLHVIHVDDDLLAPETDPLHGGAGATAKPSLTEAASPHDFVALSAPTIAEQIEEILEWRRVLTSAPVNFVAGADRQGFSKGAAARLGKLEDEGLMVALGVFAEDVRGTATKIVALLNRGAEEEAAAETTALAKRCRGAWGIERAEVKQPHLGLGDLASSLDVGLGPELRRWLADANPLGGIVWEQDYGASVDRFLRYHRRLLRRLNRP
jgi:hypothetical protein